LYRRPITFAAETESSGKSAHQVWVGAGGPVVYSQLRRCAFDAHLIHCKQHFGQVANLLCAQTNSAANPQPDGKWTAAHL